MKKVAALVVLSLFCFWQVTCAQKTAAASEASDGNPINRSTHEIAGRTVLRYEHEGSDRLGSKAAQKRFFDVVAPKDSRSKHPLLICLHSAGEKNNTEWRLNVPRIAAAGDDFVGLIPNCNFDTEWWWGHDEILKDKKKYQDALTPIEARILAEIEWVVQKYSVDRNRIYMHGISMGGSGTLGIGMSHGDMFAALCAGVPAGANHMLIRQKSSKDKNPPPALVFFSQTDDWSAEMPLLLKAAEESRYAFICAWGPWGHQNHYEMTNPAAFEFPWLSIRRNEAYPVFTNTSSDQKFPGCKSKEPDQEGQINAYCRWTNLKDQPNEFAIQIQLVSKEELKNKVQLPNEVVADVTLRRIQQFKIEPEEEYRWTVARSGMRKAEGRVKADADGLITIPGITVTAQPLQLTLVSLSQK